VGVRVTQDPLGVCPTFDQHRQNNKAILRGLRAKVYSAEATAHAQRENMFAEAVLGMERGGVTVAWNLCPIYRRREDIVRG
jgi:hypothetical protein